MNNQIHRPASSDWRRDPAGKVQMIIALEPPPEPINKIEQQRAIIDRIAKANTEINQATDEQSAALNEIASSVGNTASESEEATRRLLEASDGIAEINRSINQVRVGVGKVTRNVGEIFGGLNEVSRNVVATTQGNSEIVRNAKHLGMSPNDPGSLS